MRIGFTGTQFGMSFKQRDRIEQILLTLQPEEVDHGMCIGSDKHFHELVRKLFTREQCRINGHPCTISSKQVAVDCDILWPVRSPLTRNLDIVMSTKMLLATPLTPETLRSGTWATIRRARQHDRPRILVMPDGEMIQEGIIN